MRISFKLQCAIAATVFLQGNLCYSQKHSSTAVLNIDTAKTHQTIRNFGASDAWSCQFLGNWPAPKKNAVADWLFSMDTLQNGSPKGIGLTMWRYNIGAGSAEQGDSSSIGDEWRRAALVNAATVKNDSRIQAQNWFLQAAKERGVKEFLGFLNSPPVQLTINGKAHAYKGISNISSSNYTAFATYVAEAMKSIEQSTGIQFDYISPVNEPQWDWSDNNQEGTPYNNSQISAVVKSFNEVFTQNKITSKLIIAEAGQLDFLIPHANKNKGNQVNEFFDPNSSNYIGNLSHVAKTITGHSYFLTSPFDKAMTLRAKLKENVAQKNIEFWQSEYCILGDNHGEIDGNKRDLGMTPALYIAKVIYEDLVGANASAWHWWLTVSPYNYKDGLIYIDKNKTDGNYYDSKMLWALGNYSRFVRPGMQRIEVTTDSKQLLVSGYKNQADGSLVLVIVNSAAEKTKLQLNGDIVSAGKKIITYTTDETKSLKKNIAAKDLDIPAASVVTVLVK